MQRLKILSFEKSLKKALLWLLIFAMLVIVIDILFNLWVDPHFQDGTGYPHGYNEVFENEETRLETQYGFKRVFHNFRHFFQYWQKPPAGQTFNTLKGFLLLDGNSLEMNISHFFVFFIAGLVLWLLGLDWYWVFVISTGFNIIHEYVVEGIYIDPSFNDLWVDQAAIILAIVVIIILSRFLKTLDKRAG